MTPLLSSQTRSQQPRPAFTLWNSNQLSEGTRSFHPGRWGRIVENPYPNFTFLTLDSVRLRHPPHSTTNSSPTLRFPSSSPFSPAIPPVLPPLFRSGHILSLGRPKPGIFTLATSPSSPLERYSTIEEESEDLPAPASPNRDRRRCASRTQVRCVTAYNRQSPYSFVFL